jgi:hypothetical protein
MLFFLIELDLVFNIFNLKLKNKSWVRVTLQSFSDDNMTYLRLTWSKTHLV